MQNASVFNLFYNFWNELSKMRTAIFLLAASGSVNLAGTFLTQGLPAETYLGVYGPFWGQLWLAVGLDDILHTPWFLLVLALLLASISSCLCNQSGRMIRAFLMPKTAPKGFIGWVKIPRKTCGKIAEEERQLWGVFSAQNGKNGKNTQNVTPSKSFGENTHYYQKGRHVRIGYLCLHIGILLVAVAGLVSGLGGWRGTFNLRVDEPDNVVLIFKGETVKPIFLPFDVVADTFDITRYENGAPRQYESDLVVLEQGLEVHRGVAAVNHPFRYGSHFFGGYAFYQSDFGDGGSDIRLTNLPLDADLQASQEGEQAQGQVYDTLKMGDFTLEIFDGHAQTEDNHGAAVDVNLLAPTTAGHSVRLYVDRPDFLGLPDGENAEGEPNFTPLALGVAWDTGNIHILQKLLTLPPTVESLRAHASPILTPLPPQERLLAAAKILSSLPVLQELGLPALPRLTHMQPTIYTGLQVAYDPGANLFWLACILTLLGIFLLLGQSHIEVWVVGKVAYVRNHRGIIHTKKSLEI